RSREVATPTPTRAVSIESTQHLTGRESLHAVVVFVRDRFAQGKGPLLVAREPIAPQRGLWPRRDLGRQRDRRVERGARRDQPVRESHAKRFLTGHPAAGQDEVERMAVPDQSSDPNRPPVRQWNAPAPAVHTEDRVLRGDAEIAPRRELDAAGDRVPFDGSDDRLGKQHARRPDRAVAVAVEATRPLHPRLSHRLQIGAGAEGAVRSGEDGDVERLAGFEAAERIGKRRGPTRMTSSPRVTSARRESPSPPSTTTRTGCAGRCAATQRAASRRSPGTRPSISWPGASARSGSNTAATRSASTGATPPATTT